MSKLMRKASGLPTGRKQTAAQKLASQENYLLFQLKGMRGNICKALITIHDEWPVMHNTTRYHLAEAELHIRNAMEAVKSVQYYRKVEKKNAR